MGITLNLNLDVSEVSEGFKTSEKCEIFWNFPSSDRMYVYPIIIECDCVNFKQNR
jgi:hypothetical protein